MSNETQNPGASLLRSMATESLAGVLGDMAELAVDSVLEDGVLRDIPIIGMVAGMLKAGRDIRNELFLRKIAKFLSKVAEPSDDERLRFVEEFASDAERQRFGETLLLILERADDVEKPKIVGRIVAAAIKHQIDIDKALRVCTIVNRCYTQDLNILGNFEPGPQPPELRPFVESLHAAGVLSAGGIDGGDFSDSRARSGTIYRINEYGELLLKYGLMA